MLNETYITPAMDVVSSEGAVTLYIDLPGVRENELDVAIDRDQLTVTAHRSLPEPEGAALRHREISGSAFRRAVRLSEDLDTLGAAAELRDGVLRLLIPRRQEVLPRKIPVTVV